MVAFTPGVDWAGEGGGCCLGLLATGGGRGAGVVVAVMVVVVVVAVVVAAAGRSGAPFSGGCGICRRSRMASLMVKRRA